MRIRTLTGATTRGERHRSIGARMRFDIAFGVCERARRRSAVVAVRACGAAVPPANGPGAATRDLLLTAADALMRRLTQKCAAPTHAAASMELDGAVAAAHGWLTLPTTPEAPVRVESAARRYGPASLPAAPAAPACRPGPPGCDR